MVSSDSAIELNHVSKTYGRRIRALRDVALRVRRGEIFGLLGPNGAGKSTLVKILVTVIQPTQAVGTVLGQPVGHKPTLARIGYLPESHRFPRHLTGRQTLTVFAALANVERRLRRRRADELLELVGMSQWADHRVGIYSKGMMQRLGVAQALANDPELVLLDEPTDGVDPVGRRDLRNVLLALRDRGKTVFINSHLLSELEMVCDRVAILVAGQVARQGTLDELTLSHQRYEIELALNGEDTDRVMGELLVEAHRSGLIQSGQVHVAGHMRYRLTAGPEVELKGPVLSLMSTEPADVQPVLDAIRQRKLAIRRVQLVRPSLEELFIEAISPAPPPIPLRAAVASGPATEVRP